MKIKYGKPFGTLESKEVIVNLDYPVFYFAENENKEIYLVYVYSEYGCNGEHEEVLIIPYSSEKYKKVLNGNISLIDSILKNPEIFFIKDDYYNLDYEKINPNSLNFDKLPAKGVFYANGEIMVKDDFFLVEMKNEFLKPVHVATKTNSNTLELEDKVYYISISVIDEIMTNYDIDKNIKIKRKEKTMHHFNVDEIKIKDSINTSLIKNEPRDRYSNLTDELCLLY